MVEVYPPNNSIQMKKQDTLNNVYDEGASNSQDLMTSEEVPKQYSDLSVTTHSRGDCKSEVS